MSEQQISAQKQGKELKLPRPVGKGRQVDSKALEEVRALLVMNLDRKTC
jgi:formate dehydrogenase